MAEPQPSDDFLVREETLADDLLAQALESLLASGKRDRLRLKVLTKRDGESDRAFASRLLAQQRAASHLRLRFARSAILFAALAGEALINHFLYLHLSGKDFTRLDRLDPAAKFMFGPRIALGDDVLKSDEEPMGSLTRLFKLRNELVHPKTKPVHVRKGWLPEDPRYKDFNPEAAAGFLVAVASSAVSLDNATNKEMPPGPAAKSVLEFRETILDFGQESRMHLPPAPPTLRQILRRRGDPVSPEETSD